MQKNTTILVTERPFSAHTLAPFARDHWPNDDIVVLSATPYANVMHQYPRGLKLSEYPRLTEPVTSLAPWLLWRAKSVDAQGKLHDAEMTDSAFKGASSIVFAGEPDPTGIFAFDALVKGKLGATPGRRFPALMLASLAESDIKKAFGSMIDFESEFGKMLNSAQVKRYFDYNWNANALAILGSTTRTAGQAEGAPPLSKYSLQALYCIADHPEGIKDGELVQKMSHWVGTGAHSGNARLGSPASYAQMIENLQSAGLVRQEPSTRGCVLVVTGIGSDVLSKLHKDCRDADLPFRIQKWCEKDFAEVKPAMDLYLNTFFGKQKGFAAKQYLSSASKNSTGPTTKP